MATTGHDDKLKVFVSSEMIELRDVRECVERALENRGIHAWVYEAHAGARPETVEETSLKHVEDADIYVGLFWAKYGAVTVQEWHRARQLEKPCFIYIRDKDSPREKQLADFLQAEVYDIQGGVTYEYFSSAGSLGEQVADDIMTWLVGRHREMTAELRQANVSQIEIARLQSEVDRLQAATFERLPQGTEADYLAQQVRAWFETLGYHFERHSIRTTDYFEWIITVPARRGYDRILVRGIEGQSEISDVAAVRQAVSEQKTDEGWLLAAHRVSQAAHDEVAKPEHRQLLCYTFDELIDERADFGGYLNWLEAEVKRRGIDTMYVPLACIKEEFDPVTKNKVGESRYDERNGWADGYIDRWLDDPAKEHISILGEFGTGKTWLALHYAWTALQRYRDAKQRGIKRPRLPLYIPLRDYARADSVESLLSEFFFRKHEIPLPGYSAFEQLNRMGKLLLIFDGFDEMAARVDRQKMINNFWGLARVVVPGTKVILTSRTEHFPEAREGRALLSAELQASTAKLDREPPQFEVIELDELTDAQIRQILSLRGSDSTIRQVMDNPQLLDLARRPVMTDFILEALPDIESGKPVDLSRVYLYASRRKMERDINTERTFTSLADKLYFVCELSWEMLVSDQMGLNYRLFPDHLRRLFGHAVQEQKDLDHWQYDMMSQTMLIRNTDGDYTPAHRSLLEFFVAYKFAAELGILARDFSEVAQAQSHLDLAAAPQDYSWSSYFRRKVDEFGNVKRIAPLRRFVEERPETLVQSIGKQPITKTISLLLDNMLDVDANSKNSVGHNRDGLLRIALSQKNKSFDDVSYLPGNIITILKRLGSSFVGQDFSHLCLAGADFSNANLTGANFANCLLLNCNFSNCNLTEAIFADAEFQETSWGENGGVYSLDVSPDDNYLVTSVQGEGIEVWDLRSGTVFAKLAITDTIYVTRFSYDGNCLAAVTRSGEVVICDRTLQKTLLRTLAKHYKIENLCFGYNGTLLYALGDAIHILTISSGERRILKVDTTSDIRSLSCHYQSKILAMASADGVISVLSGTTYTPIISKRVHQGSIRALDINLAGDLVASGGKDGKVALTEIPAGETKSSIQVPGSVFSLSFNPHIDHLAVSTHGKQVVILKVPELHVLHTLRLHEENVRELRYSRDGTRLLTAGYDGSVIVCSVPAYEVINTLRSGRSGKRRILCSGAQFGGAKGLTDEYILFFPGQRRRNMKPLGERNSRGCAAITKAERGIFHNYDPALHDADLVLVSCPSAPYDGSITKADDFSPSLGCIYVASAAAAEDGFGVRGSSRVKYIDGEQGLSLPEILNEISAAHPRVIGMNYIHRISSTTESVIALLGEHGNEAGIVIGGINAMLNPKKILAKYPNVVCCNGEGEKVVRRLLDGDAASEIDGVTYIQDNKLVNNPSQVLRIEDEEDIHVLYKQFGAIYKNRRGKIEAAMLTSRGCHWQCAFCSTPNSMGNARYRRIDRVIQDIRDLHRDHQVEVIHIYDDVFIANINRTQEFIQAMRSAQMDGAIVFKVLARADVLSRFPIPMLRDLRECGIGRIAIGIESGNDQMLKRIKRDISTGIVIDALVRVKQAGIRTRGFFMFGLPDESVQEMTDTYKFATFLRDKGLLDSGFAHFAKAYPGTEWEHEAIKRGKTVALSDDYVPAVGSDGSRIRRNPAIPRVALSDVDKEVVLDYVAKTNQLWAIG